MPKTERAAVTLRRSSRFQPLTPKIKYYKLLAADMWHHGFQYKEGLNVDHVPFYPTGSCQPGGLYYTTLDYLPLHASLEWPLIADVTVPNGARVYAEPCGTKWKADQLVLSNIRPFCDFIKTMDEHLVCDMLSQHPWLLQQVENQTEVMCLAAVRSDPDTLQFVHKQTELLCLAAVLGSWTTLALVNEQTEAVCLAAVKVDGCALEDVRNQTEAICRAAVARTPDARQDVKIRIDF